MTQSSEYYDPIHNQEDFNDSVILRPISLKPTVIPSLLQRGNPENTILAAYDKIKLTEYIESPEKGEVIELISLDEDSLLTILNPEGVQFLQRYSGTDIAFVTVTGQKGSGKSFFIDKILNLSNVQGNNFSLASNKPAINLWSTPFIRDDLRFFLVEVSGCSPGSKQFGMLLPYVTILSSVIINIESCKNSFSQSYVKLIQKLESFMNEFDSEKLTKQQNKAQLINCIFPKVIFKVSRNRNDGMTSFNDIRTQEIYLPDAKNPQYRGIDDDLRIHSFLNRKCINEQYIQKVSQIFNKIVCEVQQKKHRQLVFNGGIILKYLGQLSLLFHKGKNIDIDKVYTDIVRDLYLSAYNYCVICYHEALEEALSDEKPRSVDELIQIFQKASGQIFDKYNEFSLQKAIHQEYEQKLQKHIESKERLILQINKKKTDLELKKIYDESININEFNKVWDQIQSINKKYPSFTHGRDQTMGRKLAEIIGRLKAGNNIDYKAMKEIQNLNNILATKKQELLSLKQSNKKTLTQNNEKQKKNQQQKNELMSLNQEKDKKIQQLRKQIKNLQRTDASDLSNLKNQQQELVQTSNKNENILKKLKAEQNQPVENSKQNKQLQKKLQQVRSKILSQQMTLQELQGLGGNKTTGAQQTQMKLKKEDPNVNKKQQTQAPPNKTSIAQKQMKESKGNKKASK